MTYDWNTPKSNANKADPQRGFGFDAAFGFDWSLATYAPVEGSLEAFGEIRERAFSMVDHEDVDPDRLVCMIFTVRGNVIWVISMRYASRKERRRYMEIRYG